MEATLTNQDINSILRGFTIPPQPQILVDLQILQATSCPDINEISQLISKDISIAGSVLKVANSPFFGLANPVSSVAQAIMMVGTEVAINIVNGIALRQELCNNQNLPDELVVFLNRFWDSAEDTAKVAALISQSISVETPELLYSLGLFHNAGIPLMIQRHTDFLDVIKQGYGLAEGTITDAENKCFNTNHAVLGYYLARSWKMPHTVCNVIAQHHNMESLSPEHLAQGGQEMNLLAILKLAEHLVGLHYVIGRHELDLEWIAIEETICHYLNLSNEDIEDLMSACEDIGIDNQVLV